MVGSFILYIKILLNLFKYLQNSWMLDNSHYKLRSQNEISLRVLNEPRPNYSPALFIPLISSLSNRYRGRSAKRLCVSSTILSTSFFFFFSPFIAAERASIYRRIAMGSKSIRITIRIDKRDARVCLFLLFYYFFLSFFYFFRGVHGRTSSGQMVEYNSRTKLASEYFATNADFASHLSIQPSGLPWSWPEGTL